MHSYQYYSLSLFEGTSITVWRFVCEYVPILLLAVCLYAKVPVFLFGVFVVPVGASFIVLPFDCAQ